MAVDIARLLNSIQDNDSVRRELIALLSKKIVRYGFRDSPIENFHADGLLSQDDMKEIMVACTTNVALILEQWIETPELLFNDPIRSQLESWWEDPDWVEVNLLKSMYADRLKEIKK